MCNFSKGQEMMIYSCHGVVALERGTNDISYCLDNTDIDLPLWQRNLSVLITVRRVHYGEMGKAPTTHGNWARHDIECKKFNP